LGRHVSAVICYFFNHLFRPDQIASGDSAWLDLRGIAQTIGREGLQMRRYGSLAAGGTLRPRRQQRRRRRDARR